MTENPPDETTPVILGSVIGVGALSVVHVAGEHVVVHVDGAAVVDSVA